MRLSDLVGKPPNLYPIIFPVFPVAALYAANLHDVSFVGSVAVVLAGAPCIFLLLFLLLSGITRRPGKSALVCLVIELLFFSYGHVAEALSQYRIRSFPLGSNKILLPLFVVAFGVAIFFILRTKRSTAILTRILNPTAMFLLALPAATILIGTLRTNSVPVATQASTIELPEERYMGNEMPDLYYIILDGYPNNAVLADVYGFDNTGFTKDLRDRGFDVEEYANSNYAMTFLSMASSLNMTYLGSAVPLEKTLNDRKIPYAMIQNSSVLRLFKEMGYRVVNIPSGWGPTNNMKLADVQPRGSGVDEFLVVLAQTTALRPLTRRLLTPDARERILDAFVSLQEVARKSEPTFVFAHLLLPHPPYLFDSQGNPPDDTAMKLEGHVWLQRDLFLSQLQFVNGRVLDMIDRIVEAAATNPVIILQADHGSASLLSARAQNWDRPDNLMVVERMGILSAAYFPLPESKGTVRGILSPVNTFRVVLADFFGADIEQLDNRSYFSSYRTPYDFTDVTDVLDSYYSKR